MKTLDLKSFSLLILCFVVTLSVNAQQLNSNQKKASLGDWLMDTPWRVGFGGSIIKDNTSNFDSDITFFNYTYYPASFFAEKDLNLDRLSMQLVFASTSFKPHGFGSADINFKYKKISGLSINKEPMTKVTKVAWIALADTSPTAVQIDLFSP